MYERFLESEVKSKIGKGKAIILIGPRQVGKTTLINKILENRNHLFLDADDPSIRRLLAEPDTLQIKRILGRHSIVFIDEAQRIPHIGLTSKIIVDQFDNIQLILSGSSSFDLANAFNEPLTGRKWEYELFPVTWEEFEEKHGYVYGEQDLENRLIYGFYPDVLNHPGDEREILKQLVSSYLYRDILAFAGLRKSESLEKLLLLLALQVGSEVNYDELGRSAGIDKNTVSRYIDILMKGYVLFSLSSFSRNVRNEIKKRKKIYFYDNGVRNALIGNFSQLELRPDKGAIWENFLVSERLKQNHYKYPFAKMYFWRTTGQQEVDFVEEADGNIHGFEFKWKTGKSKRLPGTFSQHYNASAHFIDRSNFRDFVIR
ncbi:MAG: ATP-binding protein [Spirochaetales bacterium]|nr:ATP-binding protein [Spirochaetales bacterium]